MPSVSATTVPYFVTCDLTFSALWKSAYYKNSDNANVIFTRSVQWTKCIIVSRSKDVKKKTIERDVDIVYLEIYLEE